MQNIKHGMLRNDVYRKLREKILSNFYVVGESLKECKITQSMGVSRTPVREAFAQLQADGLVDIIPNKGVIVRGLNEDDIRDMYEIRSFIESVSAQRACEAKGGGHIDILKDILKKEKEYLQKKDFVEFLQSDFEFHCGIIKSTESRILQNLLTSMMEYTKFARRKSIASGIRAKEAYKEHIEILQAIEERNTDKAKKKMENHIKNAKENFIKNIFEKESN